MGVGKSILLTFLSILLVLSLFFLGIFWSLHIFIYPQVYENALSDSGAYAAINIPQIPGGSFIKIPEGGMPALVNSLIENTLSYLRGETPTLNLTLSVDTQKLNDFFLQSVNDLRVCNPGENPFVNNIPNCRPADVNTSEFLDQILQSRNFTITQGEKVNLANVFGLNQTDTSKIRQYVMDYEYILYGLLALVVIFSVLIFFISPSRTRWSGIDFFVSGILVFISGALLSPIIMNNIPNQIQFLEIISKDLSQAFLSRLQTYSFIAAGIGVLGFALSFFIKKKKGLKEKP